MARKTRFLASTGMDIIAQRAAVSRARYGKPMRDEQGHAPAPAPAPAPTEAPSPDHGAAFTDAFAAALAEDAGAAPAAPTPPAPPAEPGTPAAPAGDQPAGDPTAPAAEPPTATPSADAPAAPKPGETPPAPTPPAAPTPTADDIVKNLMEHLKAPPAAPTPGQEPPAEAPLYTAEETTQLSEYEKNWPDVAQAEQLKRRAEYHDLLKYVFSEVHKFVSPMQEQLRSVGNTMHLGEVKALVPDYTENLEADVAAWVDTQPAYLQAPYKAVMQQGTSEEVADLIGRYRAATGSAAPAAPTPPATPAAPAAPVAPTPSAAPATELSSAAKQAAASLAPVSGERSAAPAGEDPQDFSSAFARYAAEAEKD